MRKDNGVYSQRFLLSIFVSVLLASVLWSGNVFAAERGKLIGGAPHAMPDWFKESFLEYLDDKERRKE